jgi:pilus assembly protein CpaE
VDRSTIRNFVTAAPGGIGILAGPEDEAWEKCTPEDWKRIVDLLSQIYEFVVVDTSGAFDRHTRNAIESSTLTLLITSGEVSSIKDTRAAFQRLQNWGVEKDRVRMVLNWTGRTARVPVGDLEAGIGQKVFWELPNDPRVGEGVQLGQPVVLRDGARSRMGASIKQLARVVAGTGTAAAAREERPPLAKRLFTLRGRTNDSAMAPVQELPDSNN